MRFFHRFFPRTLGRSALVLSLTALSLCGAGMLGHTYAIELDGELVACTGDIRQAQEAVAGAERTASAALGYELRLDSSVATVRSGTLPESEDTAALEMRLLDACGDVELLYAIEVDGAPLCALREEGAAEAVLAERAGEGNFVQRVEVRRDYVPSSLETDREGAAALLAQCVQVRRVVQRTETRSLPYAHVTVEDESLFAGETALRTAGQDGSFVREVADVYIDGRLTDTLILSERTQTRAMDEVLVVGTKARGATGRFVWPTEGLVTSEFGYREGDIGSSYHEALDIANDEGAEVRAADGGTVIFAEPYYGYGNLIVIEHDAHTRTCYAHLDSIDVEVGQLVGQGEHLGTVGETGIASGPHLHFELLVDGESTDPRDVLDGEPEPKQD